MKITGHYNSGYPGKGFKRWRDYVSSSLSYQEQYEYGLKKLKELGYKFAAN